jgi:hypothetical protein
VTGIILWLILDLGWAEVIIKVWGDPPPWGGGA